MKDKDILLTGDKGFIGSHLKEEIDAVGFDIKRDPLEDIRNENALFKKFSEIKPDVVIHLAAIPGVRTSKTFPNQYYETNIIGTQNILTASEVFGVKKVLFASSSSVYGDRETELREDMVCSEPLAPYPMSKIAGEMICKMSSVPTLVFRPFTVYGENGRDNMAIPRLLSGKFEKYGDGEQTRGYTHIDDLIEGIKKLLEYEADYGVFNLGGQERVSLNELIEMVGEEINLEVREVGAKEADVRHSFANIDKARKLLGWEPKREIKKEIKKLCS